MTIAWTCGKCKRGFTRKNQRHACGTGSRARVLRNRPPHVIEIYGMLEAFAKSLGDVEIVARERHVLFRSHRTFADADIMSDVVRIAIRLPRKAEHAQFNKTVSDRRRATHVAKLPTVEEFRFMKPFLREAYEYSISLRQSGGG